MLTRAKVTEPYGYIVKPFKSSELNANIEMAIYRHRAAMREKELMKKQIISDFYNFIINAMPSAEADEDAIRKLLSAIFRERITEELAPGFKAHMEEYFDEDSLEAYLAWVADIFENFTVRVGFLEDDKNVYVEFENCPWFEDARKNPGFCLNCEGILRLSFGWSKLPGNFEVMDRIVNGRKVPLQVWCEVTGDVIVRLSFQQDPIMVWNIMDPHLDFWDGHGGYHEKNRHRQPAPPRGHPPAWLMRRMIKLSGAIAEVIIEEYGTSEFISDIRSLLVPGLLMCNRL